MTGFGRKEGKKIIVGGFSKHLRFPNDFQKIESLFCLDQLCLCNFILVNVDSKRLRYGPHVSAMPFDPFYQRYETICSDSRVKCTVAPPSIEDLPRSAPGDSGSGLYRNQVQPRSVLAVMATRLPPVYDQHGTISVWLPHLLDDLCRAIGACVPGSDPRRATVPFTARYKPLPFPN